MEEASIAETSLGDELEVCVVCGILGIGDTGPDSAFLGGGKVADPVVAGDATGVRSPLVAEERGIWLGRKL